MPMCRALRHLLFAQAAIFIGTTQAARFIMIRTMPRPLPTSSTSMAMRSLGTAAIRAMCNSLLWSARHGVPAVELELAGK